MKYFKMLLVVVIIAAVSVTDAQAHQRANYPHPAFPGPYQVGRMHLNMMDGDRPVRLDIWYPATVPSNATKSKYDLTFNTLTGKAWHNVPIADGNFPVISFSHGSDTIEFQSYETMEHWASHGHVVVSPGHTNHDIYAKVFGTTLPWSQAGQIIEDRANDLSFALDIVLAIFSNNTDETRIAASGHSAGGLAAIVQADGYIGFGKNIPADSRIDAILAISPATVFLPDSEIAKITKPLMIFGGSVDTLMPVVDNSTRLWNLSNTKRKFRVDVDNSGHGSPSNVCELSKAVLASPNPPPQSLVDSINLTGSQACNGGIIPSAYARGILNYFSTSFFNRALRGDGGFGNEGQYPYLKRGRADDYQVCYWRGNDAAPTVGRQVTACL